MKNQPLDEKQRMIWELYLAYIAKGDMTFFPSDNTILREVELVHKMIIEITNEGS